MELTGRGIMRTLVFLFFSAAVLGCGGESQDPEQVRPAAGKADTWGQADCDDVQCDHGCEIALYCGWGECHETPRCLTEEEALCKDVACPTGYTCKLDVEHCWEADCPKKMLLCAASASDPCYDVTCPSGSYCQSGACKSYGGGPPVTSQPKYPACNGLCKWGAKCGDYCPPAASCTMYYDSEGISYWKVLGCYY
jgi:hypothetical protein